MVTRFGACASVWRGYVTVSTPFSIAALISSGCTTGSKLVLICGCDSGYCAYLDALGDGERAREAAKAALAHDIAVLVTVGLVLGLAGDGEQVVVHVDGHVLLVDAGQLEGRGDEVLVFVLVDVNPVPS